VTPGVALRPRTQGGHFEPPNAQDYGITVVTMKQDWKVVFQSPQSRWDFAEIKISAKQITINDINGLRGGDIRCGNAGYS
jgi:hypothetical protein